MVVETLQPPTSPLAERGFGARIATPPYDRALVGIILPYDHPDAVFIDGISEVWHVGANGYRVVTQNDCRGHFETLPAHILIEMLWQTAACAILSYATFKGGIAQVIGRGGYEGLSLRAQVGQRICLRAEVSGETSRGGRRGDAVGQAWIDGFEAEKFELRFQYVIVDPKVRQRRSRRDNTTNRK